MLPFELLNLVMNYLTRAEQSHLSQVSRHYRNIYYHYLSLQAQEILNKMGHYLIGVTLSELVQHLAQAHVMITRSNIQYKQEMLDIVDYIDNLQSNYRLGWITTVKNLKKVAIEAKKECDIAPIVNAIAPVGTSYILPEVIPLRFYLDNICQVLILDVFGNLYCKEKLLLSQVKEVFARQQGALILTFSDDLYMWFMGKLQKIKCEQPYIHLTKDGAITSQGEFYEITVKCDQRPWLGSSRKITQMHMVEGLVEGWMKDLWRLPRLVKCWKFYTDDEEKLYMVKYTHKSKTATETVVAYDVQKFAINSGDTYLFLVVLHHDGSLFVHHYLFNDNIVSLTETIFLSWKGLDLIEEKRYVHIMASDRIVTLTYVDGKIQFSEEPRCICPPLDRYYQTYRCN